MPLSLVTICGESGFPGRRLLVSINTESRWLELANGELRAERFRNGISHVLPLLLEISQRFARPMDVPRRLAENAQGDPEAGVRLQNLLLLIRELPGDPTTVAALRIACSDASPQVRLHAAKELGAEGHNVLVELAESIEDDACSAQAVSILDRELPFLPVERTRAILDRALGGRCIQTARACLEALGHSAAAAADTLLALGHGGAAAAVNTLAKVMGSEQKCPDEACGLKPTRCCSWERRRREGLPSRGALYWVRIACGQITSNTGTSSSRSLPILPVVCAQPSSRLQRARVAASRSICHRTG